MTLYALVLVFAQCCPHYTPKAIFYASAAACRAAGEEALSPAANPTGTVRSYECQAFWRAVQ